MILERPVPFSGTDAERQSNRLTHLFFGEDDRCAYCDCRSYGTVAEYPCGFEPPRETVDTESPGYAPGSGLEALIAGR